MNIKFCPPTLNKYLSVLRLFSCHHTTTTATTTLATTELLLMLPDDVRELLLAAVLFAVASGIRNDGQHLKHKPRFTKRIKFHWNRSHSKPKIGSAYQTKQIALAVCGTYDSVTNRKGRTYYSQAKLQFWQLRTHDVVHTKTHLVFTFWSWILADLPTAHHLGC